MPQFDQTKQLSSDVYGINDYVNNIKKQFTPDINEDTLMLGIFGYTGQVFSDMIQNTIVMASEFSNESIPTKAKFEKNIIAHALGLGISDINAVPSQFDVLLTFVEDDISKWADPVKFSKKEEFAWEFIFDKDTPIYIGNFEFHTDYDIKIRKVKIANAGEIDKYSYTAQYVIDVDNPISDITNPYLASPTKMNVNGINVIFTKCTLHQVEKQKVFKKILSDSSISAKTTTFEFDGQLASFTIDVNEGGNVTHLVPVYEGLAVETRKYPYFYYSYLDSNTIRIKFDRYSYAPRINSDITIDIQTTQGEAGNFVYTPKVYPYFSFESEKYGYSNIGCEIRPVTGESVSGTDKKSIEDLKKLIPKEALSRGSITNISDLENFFNMLNTDQSKLYFYKKRDNALERLYYSFILMRDAYNVIVPTNTIDIEIPRTTVDASSSKQVVKKGQELVLSRADIVLSSDEDCSYPDHMPEGVEGAYTSIEDIWYRFENGEWKECHSGITPNFRDKGVPIELGTYVCPYCEFSGSVVQLIDHIKNSHADQIPSNLSEDEKTEYAKDIVYNSLGFVYQIPYNFIINNSPLYGMYYLSTIDADKFLDFSFISDTCLYQFIATSIHWFRGYTTNPNTYEMTIQLLQNITNEEQSSEASGDMHVRVIAVFYDKEDNPLRWAEGSVADQSMSGSGITGYKFYFDTEDEIDAYNRIRINTGLYDIGSNNESYAYFDANTKCKIFVLSQQGTGEDGLGYGLEGLDEIVPGLIPTRDYVKTSTGGKSFDYYKDLPKDVPAGSYAIVKGKVYKFDGESWGDPEVIDPSIQPYSLSNGYTVQDGIDFFYDYSEIINSVIDVNTGSGSEIFTIRDVPVVKYDYFSNEGKATEFCKELVQRKNYIDYATQVLEDAFGMDFKFFNTYGPSKLFTTDNEDEFLNRVNMSLTFKLKLKQNYDTNIINDMIEDIKNYIEDINSINTIHMPNLVSDIYIKYKESIDYFEFIDMNGYGPSHQHLYSMGMPEEVIVPEFVNVSARDDGTPDITLILV